MKQFALAFALTLAAPALHAQDTVYKFRLSVDGTSVSLTDADSGWRPAYATCGGPACEVRFSDDAISAGNPRCFRETDGETVALQPKSYETASMRCLTTDCTVSIDGGEPIAAPRGKAIDVPSHGVVEIHLIAQ